MTQLLQSSIDTNKLGKGEKLDNTLKIVSLRKYYMFFSKYKGVEIKKIAFDIFIIQIQFESLDIYFEPRDIFMFYPTVSL